MPPFGMIKTIPFPSYNVADAVADGSMLQRMAECVGANAFVSTALTMPLLLPTVQLFCGGDEDAPIPGRDTECGMTECEIVIACSSAQVCASKSAEDALRSRFPRVRLRTRHLPHAASNERSTARLTAEAVIDAALNAPRPFADADVARRFLALRRLQAGFEISRG